MTWLGNRLTHSKYLSYINHRTNSFVSLHKKCYPWKVFFLLVPLLYGEDATSTFHLHTFPRLQKNDHITKYFTKLIFKKKTVREQFKKESTVQQWIWYLPRYPKFKRKFLYKKRQHRGLLVVVLVPPPPRKSNHPKKGLYLKRAAQSILV